MNEQAIKDAYSLFVQNGYKKDINQFKALIASNSNALNDSYNLFVQNGYNKSIDDYKSLMGVGAAPAQEIAPVKKKEQEILPQEAPQAQEPTMVSPLVGGSSASSGISGGVTPLPAMPEVWKGQPKTKTTLPTQVLSSVKKKSEEDKIGGGENLYNSLIHGIGLAEEAILSVPDALIDIASIPQNALAYLTGADLSMDSKKFWRTMASTNPLFISGMSGKNPILAALDEEQKAVQAKKETYNKENFESSSVFENFKNGKYADGFELLGNAVVESAPVSLGMMVGGATMSAPKMAALGTTAFYGQNKEDLDQMHPDMPEIEKNIKALGMSAAETVYSSINSRALGQIYKEIATKEGVQAAESILKNGLADVYKSALRKYGAPIGLMGESIEEAATQITQNVISGKPAMEGVADAAIIGAASGAAQATPITLIQAKDRISNIVQEKRSASEIKKMLDDSNMSVYDVFNVSVSDEVTPTQFDIVNKAKSREVIAKVLKDKVENGEMSEDDAKQSMYVFEKISQFAPAVNKLKIPNTDKAKVLSLLKERDLLQASIKDTDEVLVSTEKQRIEDINNQIKEIVKPKERPITETVQAETAAQPALTPEQKVARIAQLEDLLNPETRSLYPLGKKEELEAELQTLKSEQDAIQEQATGAGVLRTEQPEVGLQEVGEGNAQPEVATQGTEEVIAEQPQEEVVADIERRRKEELDSIDTTIRGIEHKGKYPWSKKSYSPNTEDVIRVSSQFDAINAKYDAELDALKNKPTPTTEVVATEQVVPAIETTPALQAVTTTTEEVLTDEETERIKTQLNDLVNDFTIAYSQPDTARTTSEKRVATTKANKAIKKLNDFFGFTFGNRSNEEQANKQDALSNIKSLLDQNSPLVEFADITELMDAYKNDKLNNIQSPLVKSVDTIFGIAPTAPLKTQAAAEVSSTEQVTPTVEAPIVIEDVINVDTKEEGNLRKVMNFLDNIENSLDEFGRTGAGMNIALPVAKAIIRTIKALVQTGITLEQAIRTAAAQNNVKEEDVIEAINVIARKPTELSEAEMPGYDRLMGEVDGIIERSTQRGASPEKILSNVIEYVSKSAVYERANDTQREQLIRDARKSFGKKEKAAPSAAKVTGAPKPTKVTVNEMTALKDQIRLEARAARDAKTAIKNASVALAKSLDDFVKKGKVTSKQVSVALKKFSSVNVLDNESVDRFISYMTKIFDNAEYVDKIEKVSSKIKRAKDNAQTKLGIAKDLIFPLIKMLNIDPYMIPDAVLDKYIGIVNMIGERATVLTLAEKASVINDVNEVLAEINKEESLAMSLSDILDSFEDKVFNDDGSLNYNDTINRMLDKKLITQEDADIMKKYKSTILPSEKTVTPQKVLSALDRLMGDGMTRDEAIERLAFDLKMTGDEINNLIAEAEKEKNDIINVISSMDIDVSNMPSRDERSLAKNLKSLIKTDAIKGLDINSLKNLLKVIDNINNGYLPHYAAVLVGKMNSFNDANKLKTSIVSAKLLPLTKLISKAKELFSSKKYARLMIERGPTFFIDQVLGDFKTKNVFESLFEKAASAQASFQFELNKVQNILDGVEQSLMKVFKSDANKVIESKFKMMAYMLQLEYQSNPGSKQVNPAIDVLNATIKQIESEKTSFTERDAELLKKIKDDYSTNGQIDIDKLYNSFNSVEKNAIKKIQDINSSMTDKAVYTASVLRGDKISVLDNYVHHNVLHETEPTDITSGTEFVNDFNNSLRPSTRAKSLIERTGKVSPINFDILSATQRGSKYVLMDYHLTEPITTARRTLLETAKLLNKEGKASKQNKEVFNAIEGAFESVVKELLVSSYEQTSIAGDAVDYIAKTGYRTMLAGTARFVAELISNISYAVWNNPMAMITAMKNKSVLMSNDFANIMHNLKSKQTTRLFPHDTLSGRMIDRNILRQASGVKGGKTKSYIANKLNQIHNLSLKKATNSVELIADTLIGSPDKMTTRPIWLGSFIMEFNKITGTDPNFDKIASNDEEYMSSNEEALNAATRIADENSVLAASSNNAFMGLMKGMDKSGKGMKGAAKIAFNNFNNFMTGFMINDFVAARTAVMAAIGNGRISRGQGVRLLGAVTTRMVVYSMLMHSLSNALASLFVGDDEEEKDEKTFKQSLGQNLTSAFSSLLIGRDFGNAIKTPLYYGIERFNENNLDFLREGKYDPYKDAIQYSLIPSPDKISNTSFNDLLAKASGPFSPALQTANMLYEKMGEKERKEPGAIERQKLENELRLPIEVAGNAGLIPLYKDIRNIVLKYTYKSLDEEKAQAERRKEEKELVKQEEEQKTKSVLNEMLQDEDDPDVIREIQDKINSFDLTDEEKEVLKQERKADRERKKELLGEYENESQMKRYDPDLWEERFGEQSDWYKDHEAEKEMNKELRRLETEMEDRERGYIAPSKGKKKGGWSMNSDGTKKRSSSWGSKSKGW